jgi:uroporphyrinogen-III synthase
VALLEARMAGEMADLVRRYGGSVRSAAAVSEQPIDCAKVVQELLTRLEQPARRVFVFLTGVGATALFEEADRQGRLTLLIEALKSGTVACRGPKPTAALKRVGVSPTMSAADPYTSQELLDAMGPLDLASAEVTLVHYGERSEPLAAALRARGAVLHELCVYEWCLPDDIGPLQGLIRAIAAREVDTIIFTSQVQWKHMVRVASDMGLEQSLREALDADVVVASVGPVCSAALREAGIEPRIEPTPPKMGPLVAALAEYFFAKRA